MPINHLKPIDVLDACRVTEAKGTFEEVSSCSQPFTLLSNHCRLHSLSYLPSPINMILYLLYLKLVNDTYCRIIDFINCFTNKVPLKQIRTYILRHSK